MVQIEVPSGGSCYPTPSGPRHRKTPKGGAGLLGVGRTQEAGWSEICPSTASLSVKEVDPGGRQIIPWLVVIERCLFRGWETIHEGKKSFHSFRIKQCPTWESGDH